MPAIDSVLDALSKMPDFECGAPASDEDIRTIEQRLSVTLPEQYVVFLKRFGSVEWSSYEIYGTPSQDEEMADVVGATLENHEEDAPLADAGLPQQHVVIAEDGGGGCFVLYTVGAANEGAVHWYNRADSEDPIMQFASLADYIQYSIDNTDDDDGMDDDGIDGNEDE